MERNNHVIIYDDTCPMCGWYTQGFVKTGLLPKSGRQAFSKADPALLAVVDQQRCRNEIPLVDKATHKVYYGIEALLKIIGQKCPLLSKIGAWRPIKWLLLKSYRLVSYNRRVIVAPAPLAPGSFDCSPDFNRRYRIMFLLILFMVNVLLLFPLHRSLPAHHIFGVVSLQKLLLVYLVAAGVNVFLALLLPGAMRLEYLGQVYMVATVFLLLLIPLYVLNSLTAIHPLLNTIWIGFCGGITVSEYVRRARFAGILPHFRWVAAANIITVILVGATIFIYA